MTQTITTLLAQDFAANQLNLVYEDLLDQRIANRWEAQETNEEMAAQHERHTLMLRNNHHLAVTLDWFQQLMTEAFEFITRNEGAKFVRNLYLVHLAVDDLFLGSIYHELEMGELTGPDAVQALLGDVKTQVQREILGQLKADGAYTQDQTKTLMDQLWYFASCGLIGEAAPDLAYGNDVLVINGVCTKPTTLINTGELNEDAAIASARGGLEALLGAAQ